MNTPGQVTPKIEDATDLRHDRMDFVDADPIEPESPIEKLINESATITAVELDQLENDAPENMAAAYHSASMEVAADASIPGNREEEAEKTDPVEKAIDNEHHRK